MELTTCFGLHFQATRLYGEVLSARLGAPRGVGTTRACHPPWVRAAFKRDLGASDMCMPDPPERNTPRDRTVSGTEVMRWALPVSVALTKGIPVGFFSSAD